MAESKCNEVRDALHRRRMFFYPQPRQRPGQMPGWEASFEGPYADGSLQGEWRLHGRWRYWSDPDSGNAILQESSVGVTAVTHGHDELPQSACIARYDVELYGRHRGRHINVFQPLLEDRVHWCYLDATTRFQEWVFDELLEFLISDLPDELISAGWPAA